MQHSIESSLEARAEGGLPWFAGPGRWIALCACAFLCAACGSDSSEEGIDYEPVPVTSGMLTETVTASGVLQPLQTVIIQPEISGVVASVKVSTGDRVEAGEPLIELRRERLEHRVAELEALLAVRNAEAAKEVVWRAEQELRRVKLDHERTRGLYEANTVSAQEIEDSDIDLQLGQIDLSDAKADRVARLATVRQAEQALRRAQEDLIQSVVRSPITGVVVRLEVDVGSAVADAENGGTVVAVIADDRELHLLCQVDEFDVAHVRSEQKAQVRIDAFDGEIFDGHVRKVSFSGTRSGTSAVFEAEVFVEPDERIRVGMSAEAHIQTGSRHAEKIVPSAAVDAFRGEARVRLSDGSEAGFSWVPVKVLHSNESQVAIEAPEIPDNGTVLVPLRSS